MEDIARAVGLRKATLYHYFASKDDLLLAIHEEFIDLLVRQMERREAVPMPVPQSLLEIMGDILAVHDTHSGHVRVFYEHHRELAEVDRLKIAAKRDRYFRLVEDEIRRGIAEGSVRPLDTRLATLALFGMVNWAYQWYRTDGPLRTRDIAYVFWDVFMNGVAPAAVNWPARALEPELKG
jgi:AcrR family transcriptional regulator